MAEGIAANVLKKYRTDPSALDVPSGVSSLQFNPQLEQQAQGAGQTQLHPMIAAIMQKLGLMSLLRNRSNEAMTADSDPNNI